MKIAILSRNHELYSTRRLLGAASDLGHEVQLIDILRCYMGVTTAELGIHYRGARLPHFDAVIPRIAASHTFYGASVVRHFETMGTFSINRSICITRSRDKLRSLQLLSRKGVGMPATGIAHATSAVEDLVALVGGAPLVIKVVEGSHGKGVVLAETEAAAVQIIQSFFEQEVNVIVQEFIEESKGVDIRCIVLGNKVIASMKRQALPGEFRSNIHCGGRGEAVKITRQERETAVSAARSLGLNFAGVDLLRSNRGPLVMEVNSSPGLKGIEKATGIDIAKLVISYIEKYAKPITRNSHYEG